tara:strand:+ start:4963 stop:5745 length:783 start_codon:yes stop_codon:yes gene_type:complete
MYFVHYYRGTCGSFITRNINNALDLDCFVVSPLGNCHFQNIQKNYKYNFLLKGKNYVNYFLKNNIIDKQIALEVEGLSNYNFLLNYSNKFKIINITYSNADIFQLNYNFFSKYYLDNYISVEDQFKKIFKKNVINNANKLTKEEYTTVIRSLIHMSLKDIVIQPKITKNTRIFNLKFSDIMYYNEKVIDSLLNFLDNKDINKKKFIENFLAYQKNQTYVNIRPLTLLDFEKLDELNNIIQNTYKTYLETVKFKNENINYR